MSEDTGLALYNEREEVDQSGSAFFREAYRIVCESDPDRRSNDRVFHQGGLKQIAEEYKLDLTISVGFVASTRLFSAFVSLALSKVSGNDPVRAVNLLRKNELALFLKLGMQLHDELRQSAAETRKASVIGRNGYLYGLLEKEHEEMLVRTASTEIVFEDWGTYQQTVEQVEWCKTMVMLGMHLPLPLILEQGEYLTSFHKEAYRRKNETTPNSMGGIFFLFVRSFLIKALTTSEHELPVLHAGTISIIDARGQSGFLRENFVSVAQRVQALVADIFFDPTAVAAHAGKAVAALQQLFRTSFSLGADSIGFRKMLGLELPDLNQVVAELAGVVLRTFSESVRKYFATATNVTVSAADMSRFWYPNLLMRVGSYTGGISGDPEVKEDRLLLVDDKDIAVAVTDLKTLLQVTPDKLVAYTDTADQWPAERRQAFLDRYRWNDLLEAVADDDLIRRLTKLVARFGPELLRKLSGRRLTLMFWFRAWNEAPALRNALLTYFEEDRYPHPVSASSLMNAVIGAYGVGGDERLFALLLARAMRDVPGKYLRGVAAEQMGSAIYQLINHPPSLKLLMARVDPKKREEYLGRLGSDAFARYTIVMSVK